MEEWRDIIGYEGVYQVSSEGRVRSLDRECMRMNGYGKESLRKDKGCVLKPGRMGGNVKRGEYMCVHLARGSGDMKMKYIHRLVAQAFIPNDDPEKTQIDHINSNKADNRVENLEWVSASVNSRRRVETARNKILTSIIE